MARDKESSLDFTGRGPLSTPRLVAVALFLTAVIGVCGYFLHLPLLQLYWGVYARLRPMLSEADLVAAGKPVPESYRFDLSHSGLEKRNHNVVVAQPRGSKAEFEGAIAGAQAGNAGGEDGDDEQEVVGAAGAGGGRVGRQGAAVGERGGGGSGGTHAARRAGAAGAKPAQQDPLAAVEVTEEEETREEAEAAAAKLASGQGERRARDAGLGEQAAGKTQLAREAAEQQQQQQQQGATAVPQEAAGAGDKQPPQGAPEKAEPPARKQSAPGSALAEKHRLTKELVASVAVNNTVMVTWANYHYKDFVMNWVEHLQATGCTAFLVGALDDKLLEHLLAANITSFAMSTGLTTEDFGWGSPSFHKMGREKINLIYAFTKMGFDVLISDVDTVWLRNPIPYMQQLPDADILTSSDHLLPTHSGEGLEKWPEAASAANIGVMFFRPSAHEFAQEWVEVLEADDNVWDQNAFNDLFRRGADFYSDRKDNIFLGYDRKLKIGILPVSIFCSGHTFYIQKLPEKLGLKPYVVHGTFQYSGTPGKRHRMRERMIWNDPPEYYTHPQGFIVYDPDLPKPLLEAARSVQRNFDLKSTVPHFDLVNYQLRQVRALFALSQVFRRAAILPDMWCGMDRWWAPHDGTIPGGSIDLPFRCPADHVLDLELMYNDPAAPAVREYSFLSNPKAKALTESILTVDVCKTAKEVGCSDGTTPAKVVNGTVRLKPGLSSIQLRHALRELAAKYKVLRFKGIERAFDKFDITERQEEFEQRVKAYVSIWCCVDQHPGHVWYDIWWDKVPHVDRHNRPYNGPWEPVCGP